MFVDSLSNGIVNIHLDLVRQFLLPPLRWRRTVRVGVHHSVEYLHRVGVMLILLQAFQGVVRHGGIGRFEVDFLISSNNDSLLGLFLGSLLLGSLLFGLLLRLFLGCLLLSILLLFGLLFGLLLGLLFGLLLGCLLLGCL